MKATEIINYNAINAVDVRRIEELKASIMAVGWQGAPILVSQAHAQLITGSHRLAALKDIYNNEWDFDLDGLGDVAEDVDDILDTWCEANGYTIDDIDYGNLSAVFGGTWVERYADTLPEW